MRHKRQGPRWWNVWLPLLLLLLVGGLLVLEPQAPLSPGGHKIAQMAIALLMYGLVACWVRCNRVALVLEEYEREYRTTKHHLQASSMSDYDAGTGAFSSAHSNGHVTDKQRRR